MQGAQSSRNGSCRLGRVMLGQFPRYSASARRLLGSVDGQKKFQKLYGDFFIRGYTLGADAGVCVTAQFDKDSSKESLQVKVTVTILGWSESVEHNESTESSKVSASLKFCGYSTLYNKTESEETKSSLASDQAKLGRLAAKYTNLVSRLEADVKRSLGELKLVEGGVVPAATAFELCRSGLVVQLLLFPHALTQEYIGSLTALSGWSPPSVAPAQKKAT
jgi:hypothetical protein